MKNKLLASIITSAVAVSALCHAAEPAAFESFENEHGKIKNDNGSLLVMTADGKPALTIGSIITEDEDGNRTEHKSVSVAKGQWNGMLRIHYENGHSILTQHQGARITLDISVKDIPWEHKVFLEMRLADGVSSGAARDHVRWRFENERGDFPERNGTVFALEGTTRPVFLYTWGGRASSTDNDATLLRIKRNWALARIRFGETGAKAMDTATAAAVCDEDLLVDIATARPYNIFKPGEAPQCDITLRNTRSGDKEAAVKWTVRDFGGKVVDEGSAKVASMKYLASKTWNVSLPPAQRECYTVEVEAKLDGHTTRSFANITIWDDAMKVPADSKFGVADFHAADAKDAAALAAIMDKAGARATFKDLPAAEWKHGKWVSLSLSDVVAESDAKTELSEAVANLRKLRSDGITAVVLTVDIRPEGANHDEKGRNAETISKRIVGQLAAYRAARDAEMPEMKFYALIPHWDDKFVFNGGRELLDGYVRRRFAEPWGNFGNDLGNMSWQSDWFGMKFVVAPFYSMPVKYAEGKPVLADRVFAESLRFAAHRNNGGVMYMALRDGSPSYYGGFGDYVAGLGDKWRAFAGGGLMREPDVNGGEAKPALLAFQFAAMLAAGAEDVRVSTYQNGLSTIRFDYRGAPVAVLALGNKVGVFHRVIDDLKYREKDERTSRKMTFVAKSNNVVVCDAIGRKTKVAAANGKVTLDTTERPVVVFGVGDFIGEAK